MAKLSHGSAASLSSQISFLPLQDTEAEFHFKSLTKFQRLVLIKLLRSDALISAIRHFINETLGQKFLDAGVPTLQDLYNQSQANTPIIFILSPGKNLTLSHIAPNRFLLLPRFDQARTLPTSCCDSPERPAEVHCIWTLCRLAKVKA